MTFSHGDVFLGYVEHSCFFLSLFFDSNITIPPPFILYYFILFFCMHSFHKRTQSQLYDLPRPQTTGEISSAGPTVSFIDPVEPVQKAIDELTAKGIKRIIAVSHHGYGPDMEVAAKTRGLDLIVGGHSHTYLGDPKDPMYQGPYPTLIKNLDGEETLIVQVHSLFFSFVRSCFIDAVVYFIFFWSCGI